MLAHKVDGENPITCSELLLAAWELGRWAEARGCARAQPSAQG